MDITVKKVQRLINRLKRKVKRNDQHQENLIKAAVEKENEAAKVVQEFEQSVMRLENTANNTRADLLNDAAALRRRAGKSESEEQLILARIDQLEALLQDDESVDEGEPDTSEDEATDIAG